MAKTSWLSGVSRSFVLREEFLMTTLLPPSTSTGSSSNSGGSSFRLCKKAERKDAHEKKWVCHNKEKEQEIQEKAASYEVEKRAWECNKWAEADGAELPGFLFFKISGVQVTDSDLETGKLKQSLAQLLPCPSATNKELLFLYLVWLVMGPWLFERLFDCNPSL